MVKSRKQGDKLIAEAYGQTELEFFYDESGAPYALLVRNIGDTSSTETWYYYVTNLQGDVVMLLDASGNTVAEYSYNAWGQILNVTNEPGETIGDLNPIRYRGYYYDAETGLYYVSSRYYDPEICRWINADDQFDKGAGFIACNLFAYCANNPVVYKDNDGSSIVVAIVIGAVVGLAAGGFFGSYRASKKGYKTSDGWDYWKYVATYGVYGALLGGTAGWGIGVASASSTASALGSAGSGGTMAFESWQAAEQALRNSINSAYSVAERTFNTPFGRRIVDAYNSSRGLIAEAKYGYQGLSKFIKTEIARDAWLLENERVKLVEWHFYFSEASQSIGPSAPLFDALRQAGIKVIIHILGG